MITIPIYAVCSESHRPLLYHWFLKTLPKGLEPKIKHTKEGIQPGGWSIDGYKKGIIAKTKNFINAIEATEDIGVLADIDLCFFAKDTKTLFANIDLNNNVLCPEDESFLPSTGFLIFKKTRELLNIWKEILVGIETQKFFGDQDGFRELYKHYKVLPRTFSSYYFYHGFSHTNDPDIEKDCLLYHGNNSKDVREKMILLQKVWDKFNILNNY